MFRLGFAIVIGYVLNKKRMINAQTNKSISAIIVNVSNPALVIYAVTGQQEVNAEVIKLIGFGAVLYLLLPLAALAAVLLIKPKLDERGVYQMLLVFGNIIFMGFPIVQAMYGNQAILYLNILNLPFTLLIFTYGVRLLRGRQGGIGGGFTVKDLLTPGFLSALASLIIYLTRLKLPGFLVNALGFVGGLTTPLSMIVLGSMMAAYSFRDILRTKKLYLLSFVKLLVMPAAGYVLARLLFSDPVLVGVITISLAMPSATLCAMLGEQYGTEQQAGLAAQGVLMTTILSLVSIPLVIFALT